MGCTFFAIIQEMFRCHETAASFALICPIINFSISFEIKVYCQKYSTWFANLQSSYLTRFKNQYETKSCCETI